MNASEHSEIVEAEGHLIDSQLLNAIFDAVIRLGAAFEVQRFDIGRTNDEMSQLRLKVTAPSGATLQQLLEELVPLGCRVAEELDAVLAHADQHGCAPDDFYSTTNQRTLVRVRGRWIEVERQRMDAVIVVEDDRATCRKLRDIRDRRPDRVRRPRSSRRARVP